MIEELRRFILAAEKGNITKTAEKLFITQSALSQSIRRLEKSLHTKLFTQQGKRMQLTTDGLAIRLIGTKILELWETAKNPEARKSIRPLYTIGLFDNAAMLLAEYLKENMHTEAFHLDLIIDRSTTLLSQLQLGIIDLAVCVVHKKHTSIAGVILKQTFRETLIPVSSVRFTKKLSEIPFILYNKHSHTREQIDDVFMQAGITPTIFAEATSVTFMKELALLGCGVALLPENFVRTEIGQGMLQKQPLPLVWEREYGIYLKEQSTLEEKTPLLQGITRALSEKLA